MHRQRFLRFYNKMHFIIIQAQFHESYLLFPSTSYFNKNNLTSSFENWKQMLILIHKFQYRRIITEAKQQVCLLY